MLLKSNYTNGLGFLVHKRRPTLITGSHRRWFFSLRCMTKRLRPKIQVCSHCLLGERGLIYSLSFFYKSQMKVLMFIKSIATPNLDAVTGSRQGGGGSWTFCTQSWMFCCGIAKTEMRIAMSTPDWLQKNLAWTAALPGQILLAKSLS